MQPHANRPSLVEHGDLQFVIIDAPSDTNIELYENLHPKNRELPYVYDNFEWPHCTAQGYKMINTW